MFSRKTGDRPEACHSTGCATSTQSTERWHEARGRRDLRSGCVLGKWREALPPERQVGHMVFRRPTIRRATLHPFSLRHQLEKGILADLGLAQEFEEQWLKRMVGYERFFLTFWWCSCLKDGTDAAPQERGDSKLGEISKRKSARRVRFDHC